MLKTAICGTEIAALMGLSLLAKVLYVLGVRPRMDFGTGIAGGVDRKQRITRAQLQTVAEYLPDRGSNRKHWKPSMEAVRSAIRELARAGLVVDAGSGRGCGLILFLPKALRDQSVRNMNPTGTPRKSTRMNHTVDKPENSNEFKPVTCALETMNPTENPHDEGGMDPRQSVVRINNPPLRAREEETAIPVDYRPSDEVRAHAKSSSLPAPDDADVLQQFVCHYRADGSRCADWDAKYIAWLFREKRYIADRGPTGDGRKAYRRTPERTGDSGLMTLAKNEGIEARPGESWDQYRARLIRERDRMSRLDS